MQKAVTKATKGADVLIMAAAVADYRPVAPSDHKIKKGSGPPTIHLEENPDILYGIKGKLVKVGFAAESENLRQNAASKEYRKGCCQGSSHGAKVGFDDPGHG